MAVAQKLPNGHILLLLTPREAVNLSDELLEPDEYPWQSSETQATAREVRAILISLAEEESVAGMSEFVEKLNREAASART